MFAIDSFKLRIPTSKLYDLGIDLPNNLNDSVTIISENTSEIIDNRRINQPKIIKSIKLTYDNRDLKLNHSEFVTSITLTLENQYNGKNRIEYLTLKVTSKLLKGSYYLGISSETIELIKEYLSKCEFNLPIDLLLSSELTDIDFKKDMIIKKSQYDSIVLMLRDSNQCKVEPNTFNQATNKGIEFSKRANATIRKPYLKIYNKYLDSISSKHKDFFIYYGIETNKDLHRIEFTLKNKKHFDYYKLNNTLESMLNLTQSQIETIYIDIVSKCLNKDVKRSQNQFKAGKTLLEMLLIDFIQTQIEAGKSKYQIKDQFINRYALNIKNRTTKKNNIDKFEEVYNEVTTENYFKDKVNQNEKNMKFFNQLFWLET